MKADSSNGLEVIYVEDEEDDAFLMQLALARSGVVAKLEVARDGQVAKEYMAEPSPSHKIVLLDLNLPRVSGFEVLRWIRSQSRLKDLPVIIYSSSGQASDIEHGIELGANEYIVKKANVGEIAQMLRDLAGRWG